MPELIERLPGADRLAKVASDLERLARICQSSKRCSTPEGPAVKAIVYGFMESALDDAAFAALALRQLTPCLATLTKGARDAG